MLVLRIVVDTNVFVSALLSADGASRAILRLCLNGDCQPLMGETLFHEYGDVLGRKVLESSPLSRAERKELFAAFLSVCDWVPISFLWRPNLPDEGDNHLIELAVAGGATSLVTSNTRDLRRGELLFPRLSVESPGEFVKRWRRDYGNDDNPAS